MKRHLKYLLAIFVLMLGAFSLLHGFSGSVSSAGYAGFNDIEVTYSLPSRQAIAPQGHPERNWNLELTPAESEEDEVRESKILFSGSRFYTAAFFAITVGYIFLSLKKNVPGYERYVFRFIPQPYILFRVLRL